MKTVVLSLVLLFLLIGIAVPGCNGGGDGNGGSNGYVPPPSPADFRVSNLAVTPSEVGVGEEVVVSVDVSNTGGSQGTYTATLEINGGAVETKDIVVAAGATETVSFQLTEDAPGMYTASLDGLTATLKVGVELIAFSSNRDGDLEIYVMNTDGSGVLQLTFNIAHDLWPSLSPDGQKIAFDSNMGGDFEIYIYHLPIFMTSPVVVALTDNAASDRVPKWSPDGQRIAFISDRDGDDEIYVMNADGSNVVKLTDNAAFDFSPSWSPDGQRIAFISDRDGNIEIYVMNADGSNVVRLTDNTAWDLLPSWSPDGRKISFDSDRDGDYEIYVMNADGSNVVKLTDNIAEDGWVSWTLAYSEVGIPGDTLADIWLQGDVLYTIMAFERVRAPGCTDPEVIDSEVTGLSADGKWEERWTLDSCGETVAYDISYVPDPQGGTFLTVSFAGVLVTFPDTNLEAAIREAIDKPQGPIYSSDLEAITTLDAQERSISDLTGLEYCINLEELNLTGSLVNNLISDISPLAGLINLKSLYLPMNSISDISPLASLTNLELLSLHHNNISDISPLAGLTNLETLGLEANDISDISPVAGLTNLEWLSLINNNISDISSLVENNGLSVGDWVLIFDNPLSTTSVNVYIPQLEARGVEVEQ